MRTFRNAAISVWQSVVARIFDEDHEKDSVTNEATADYGEIAMRILENDPDSPVTFDRVEPSLREQSALAYVSGIQHHLAMAIYGNEPDASARIQARLRPFEEGIRNWQWGRCVVEYGKYVAMVHNGPTFRSPEFAGELNPKKSVFDGVLPDDEGVTLALVGDWGTGEPAAQRVLDAILAEKPHILIHLGDVYFSGTDHESYRSFYKLIRSKRSAADLPVFTLAGNHDYYSGGGGYYQLIDELNEGATRQTASYFCLRNAGWQILGMDTGFGDCVPGRDALVKLATFGWKGHVTDLRDDEWRWHQHQLNDGRPTILLSHHQLRSAWGPIGVPVKRDSVNQNLERRFSSYFSRNVGQVRAWYWGHEHDFVPMERGYNGLGDSACLGHGAIPVDSAKKPRSGPPPYQGLTHNSSKYRLHTDSGGYYNRGFSLLYLGRSDNARITHFEVDEAGKASALGTEIGI
jgi:hypothetical protein